jgi:hypothetical protein
MPTYTIDVAEHLQPGLAELVARYNANNGTSLTVLEWLELHVAELAIADRLAAEMSALQAQAERDFQAATAALKDRLVKGDDDVLSS